jgi:hypothetical protein
LSEHLLKDTVIQLGSDVDGLAKELEGGCPEAFCISLNRLELVLSSVEVLKDGDVGG